MSDYTIFLSQYERTIEPKLPWSTYQQKSIFSLKSFISRSNDYHLTNEFQYKYFKNIGLKAKKQ